VIESSLYADYENATTLEDLISSICMFTGRTEKS